MAEAKTRTTVTIFGEEYSLKSDLPEEVVHSLAQHVDGIMQILASKQLRSSNSTRLAVLAALNLAEDLFDLQGQYQELTEAMQQQWRAKREVKEGTHSSI